MNVNLKIGLFVIVGIFYSLGIPANNWHSYLSCYQVIALAKSDQKIYAANENGLFSYNLQDKSFTTTSRVEGLSDQGISAIRWSASKGGLLIGYKNGNLDLLTGTTILNLPDIKLKTTLPKRSVNNIFCDGDFSFLSCDFGIVKINLKRWEVSETWFIGPEALPIAVKEVAADNQYFWAATENGIYRAEKSNANLQDFHNWTLQANFPVSNKPFNSIVSYNNNVYACDSDGKCYLFDGSQWQMVYPEISGIRKIEALPLALALVCDNRIELYAGSVHTTILNYGNLAPPTSKIFPTDVLAVNSGDLFFGDRVFGLIHKAADESFTSAVPSSPADNFAGRLAISGTNLYVATAVDTPEQVAIPAEIHRLQDQHWFSLNEYTEPKLTGLKNVTEVVAQPANQDHYYASTMVNGLLEFEGQKNTKIYNSTNSTLESLNGTCKTGGLAVDGAGNVWITNPSVKHQLHVLKPDGTMQALSYPGIDNQFAAAGELIITKTDTKWIVVNNTDLFALHTGSTTDNTNDDLYRKTSVRSRFSNSETTIIKGYNELNAISEDQNGYLWIGTENGVVLYSNPESLFGNTDFYGIQPSVDLGDGLFHPLLENIRITSIATDGGNRKWFGTANSGVFLYSADGSALIYHFNSDNSPLFSDHINSIVVNNQNGEVFFATDHGLISWKGDATSGENSFQHLYVWPNPVRETYQGVITIDGLKAESNVKITDITGNLVYKTTSNGGRATWSGKTRSGERVNTGVYLIFCSNSDGSQTRVIKLLFIH